MLSVRGRQEAHGVTLAGRAKGLQTPSVPPFVLGTASPPDGSPPPASWCRCLCRLLSSVGRPGAWLLTNGEGRGAGGHHSRAQVSKGCTSVSIAGYCLLGLDTS